jgi:uncharacterized protein VirK/YbjX
MRMVFAHLTRHWMARRHYPLASWLACIARSLRVLLFYRDHLRLLALDIYRHHLTEVHDDVFHHLSHRNYLAKGLSLRQRVRCVHTHYRFEGATFDAAYQQAVYRDGGLLLWQHDAGGGRVEVRLGMAQRLNAEGDLTLSLLADGKPVHRLSFSWVDARFAGIVEVGAPRILPFIARNQGPRTGADGAQDAVEAFRRAFGHNSPVVTTPGFFCFAALQGIARALGMDQVVAVKSAWHCGHDTADKHFANAYDGFWEILGGIRMGGRGWRIDLPFHVKPLEEIASKHRKRAMVRREQWRTIEEAARATLERHLLAPGTHARAFDKSARTLPAHA